MIDQAFNLEQTMEEVITEDYRTAEIFTRYGIDFNIGGQKSISDVCREYRIDAQKLQTEINELPAVYENPFRTFEEWSLTFLMDYIENIHHKYIRRNLPLIDEFAGRAEKFDPQNSEIQRIHSIWKEISEELSMHIKKEELVLFPFIKNLEKLESGALKKFPPTHVKTVKSPIRMMLQEHELVDSLMGQMKELSDHFVAPQGSSIVYRVLLSKLKEFDMDLRQHIKLENDLLFPKAIELEERLNYKR